MPTPAGQAAAFFQPRPNQVRFKQLSTGAMHSIKRLEKRPATSSLQFPHRLLCGSGWLVLNVQRQSSMGKGPYAWSEQPLAPVTSLSAIATLARHRSIFSLSHFRVNKVVVFITSLRPSQPQQQQEQWYQR